MAKSKTIYYCQNCGTESSKWIGHCPSCGEWNSYIEQVVSKSSGSAQVYFDSVKQAPQKLEEINHN